MTLDLTAAAQSDGSVDLVAADLTRYSQKPDSPTNATVAAGTVTTDTTAAESGDHVLLTTILSPTVRFGRLTRSVSTTGLSLDAARFLVQVRTSSTAAKVRAYAAGKTPGPFQDVTDEWTWLRCGFSLVANPQVFGVEVHPVSPFQGAVDVQLRYWRVRGSARLSDPTIVRDDGYHVPIDVDAIETALEHEAPSASYSVEVLADNPQAYWRMGEGSGAVIADSSGNGRAAAAEGTYTRGVASLTAETASPALRLPGSPALGWARCATDVAGLATDAYTVEALVKGTVGDYNVVDRDQGPGRGFQWYVQNDSGVVVVITRGASLGAAGGGYPVSGSVLDGNVHHLAFTHLGGVVRGYIDGVQRFTFAAANYTSSGSHVSIGAGYASSSLPTPAQRYLNGDVDEVAYYGTALSAARIAAHAAAVTIAPGGGGAGADLAATDHTAPLQREITYTLTDTFDPAGAPPSATDTATVEVDLDGPLLSNPLLGVAPLTPAFVLDYSAGGTPQTTLVQVIGRDDPVPALAGGTLRSGPLALFFTTYPAALAALRLALTGRVLLLRVTVLDGTDMHFVGTRANLQRASGSDELDVPPWVVTIDYAEVLP